MTDFLVIGAGAIGLATALKLKESLPRKDVLVIERNREPFAEISRYNSGVVHSGVHQKADLLKSRLARLGGPLLKRFCQKEGVLFRETAMLIVVSESNLLRAAGGEAKSLVRLAVNAWRQGIKIRPLTGSEITKLEPCLKASFGICIPGVWVVDQVSLGRELCRVAADKGVKFIFGDCLNGLKAVGDCYEARTSGGRSLPAGAVINCAGIMADKVSAMAGFNQYRVYPCRGEYYEIADRDLIKSLLVYPVVPPGSPVKGIHLTKTVDSRLLVGPNAVFWPSREDDFNVRTPPEEFYKEVRKFLPALEIGGLQWVYSGLRPKISIGDVEADFVIKKETSESPHFVNLIGIESPGLTAAFAIADYVKNLISA